MAHTSNGLILFAHGARDPEWAEPFRDISKRIAATRDDLAVRLAFLEFQTPTLADVIADLAARGHTSIHIAPLFMAQGGHLKNDVPKLLAETRSRHPALKLELLPAIGDIADLRQAIAEWVANAIPGAST